MEDPHRVASASYRFGSVEVLAGERKLLIDGQVAPIGARAFELLLALVERRERLVTRNELFDLVWPDVAVEPNNIAVQVGALRKLLGTDVIATVPGRGYRFSVALDDGRPRVKLRTNLPNVAPALFGRDDESARLGALVDRGRLVTITGAGGIGKSRLAQRLLHQRREAYAHGVCWIELAEISDAVMLPGVVAAALGIELGGGEPLTALQSALAPLALLIALDNAEHLLADIGRLVAALHEAAPALHLVVTSQAPLHLPAEQVFALGALAVPATAVPAAEALQYGAVGLFVHRARSADARFVFDETNVAEIIEITRHLDGLALAIELAAARAPLLGVRRIAASLDQRLHLLRGGDAHAPARQQALRTALEWSHGLLSADERRVYRRLAVIVGSASLELIQEIAQDDGEGEGSLDRWAVVDALGALVERSLVAASADGDDRERPRYRLLESPRAYAEERLIEAGELERLRSRHARAVALLLHDAWAERWSGRIGVDAWHRAIEPERGNARAARSWALAHADEHCLLMMAPLMLMRTLPGRSHTEQVVLAEWLEGLLAQQPPDLSQLRSRAMLVLFWNDRRPQHAQDEARRTMALAREAGDRFILYMMLSRVVLSALHLGDEPLAAASLAEMQAVEDPAWPPHRLVLGAHASDRFARVAGRQGGASPVVSHRALDLARLAGDSAYFVLVDLADEQLAAGDVQGAIASGEALVEQLQGTRFEFPLVMARANLLAARLAQGDIAAARQIAEATWAPAIGFEMQAVCADYLALLAALEQRWPAAGRLAGYAEAAYARQSMRRQSNEARAIERAGALVKAAVGLAASERWMAEGSALTDAQIPGIAFATSASTRSA